jgi:hypothetical protein
VYDRSRVSVVLALYDGSGWSRASFCALIVTRSQPRAGQEPRLSQRA